MGIGRASATQLSLSFLQVSGSFIKHKENQDVWYGSSRL